MYKPQTPCPSWFRRYWVPLFVALCRVTYRRGLGWAPCPGSDLGAMERMILFGSFTCPRGSYLGT